MAISDNAGTYLCNYLFYHIMRRVDEEPVEANILGCFMLGAVYEVGEWVSINPNARAMISVGIIGALTTFSTFTLETLNLLRKHEWVPAFLYMMLSIVIGFIACVLGIFAVRLVGRLIDT